VTSLHQLPLGPERSENLVSGTENLNSHVDELVAADLFRRIVAQIDIRFSNSMIEMLFHRLKHRHLFHIPFNDFDTAKKGPDFYFNRSNIFILQAALKGATAEELNTGKWTEQVIATMKAILLSERSDRIESN
jgi:hypothetical protein